jgi:ubiquinone/menaquinone biosynthesis C-methylase UbiE
VNVFQQDPLHGPRRELNTTAGTGSVDRSGTVSSGRSFGQAEQEQFEETIRTYDITAKEYAARFSHVNLADHRDTFVKAMNKKDALVLDAGCGSGRDCELLSREGNRVVGLDRSAGLLAVAAHITTASLVRADLRLLPFRDRMFFGIWSCASLVHLPPDEAAVALREFSRVLLPGGSLFVAVRHGNESERRVDENGNARWFHLYSAPKMEALLLRSGFEGVSARVEGGVSGGVWVNAHARRGRA